MKAIIDLSKYRDRGELLSAVVDLSGLDSGRVDDLDLLYDSLIDSSGDLDIVFVNKSDMSKDLSVYFGMLSMTIEEATENRRDLRVNTYYYEEE